MIAFWIGSAPTSGNKSISLAEAYSRLLLPPAPYYSVFMQGCLEQGRDVSEGLKYNNFGIHGAGSANAADALAAVKEFIFEERSVLSGELLSALGVNFSGYEALRRKLEEQGPKVGNNDPKADTWLVKLFDDLADACEDYGRTPKRRHLAPGHRFCHVLYLARHQPSRDA